MKTGLKVLALVLLVALIIGGIPAGGILILCGMGAGNNEMAGGGVIVLLFVIGCLIGAINIVRSLPRQGTKEQPEEKS